MNIDKAREVLETIAHQRKQWGKHAGFGPYAEGDCLDALVYIHEAGFLDQDEETVRKLREEKNKANRQTAAANARATKFQNLCDTKDARIKELVVALEESENVIANLRMQLSEA